MSDMNSTNQTSSTDNKPNSKRRKSLIVAASVVAVVGIAYGLYDWLVLSHYEETDNAYVSGNIVQITPQVGGTIQSIMADETDFVHAGQTLVKLDPADTEIALAKAEANLAQTVRQVRTLYANNSTAKAQVAQREADVVSAQNNLTQAENDLQRRLPLSANGAVSKEEINHAQLNVKAAQSTLAAAKAAVLAAQESLTSSQALTDNVDVEQHPNVLAASAQLRDAYLAAQRTDLLSPVEGFVAKRSVQLGERIAAGNTLMTVVPLKQIWVEANFKENQLLNLRIGQPATLTADLYGKKVEYHGKIIGLGIGTGAAFSLLPAQNASGNWIKVVQRVPVRIALDEKDVSSHPLRIGLSMDVNVDTSDRNGPVLAAAPRDTTVAQTQVFDKQLQDADADIQRIIASNVGNTDKPVKTASANVVSANKTH